MTKHAKQITDTDELFRKVARLKCEVFSPGRACSFDHVEVIPLIERVEDLTHIEKIIEPYLMEYKKMHKRMPPYLRPFIARSDPALNAGLIPAVISSKAAISQLYRLQDKYGVPMFPIIGTGSLPFRGSVNPENIREAIKEYSGIRTVTIQSAFKYDYPLPMVQKALKFIDATLPTLRPEKLNDADIHMIQKLNNILRKPYTETIEKLAPMINTLASFIPARRERMQHIGLFGYSRGMGGVRLPRAIAFTGALYSLGVPPEFIGTGRGLREAHKQGMLSFIERVYVNLKRDLVHAGKYLNKENLALLAKQYPAFKDVVSDVEAIEEIFKIQLGPFKSHHFLHRNTVSNIYYKLQMKEDVTNDIIAAACMRKSIG